MTQAPRPRPFEVAIVGGGISGLAAAHRLLEVAPAGGAPEPAGPAPLRVTVLEAAERFGGRVQTERHGSLLFEAGPDSLVTHSKPEGLELIRSLGLSDELIEPRSGYEPTQVVHHGRPVSLPAGFALFAPTRALPLLRSPLFTWRGKLRALAEPLVPARPRRDDESVSSFVSRRFGSELLERVAEPLLGGLFMADVDELSLKSALPRLAELERRFGSVTRGLRRGQKEQKAPSAPGVVALASGMEILIERLMERVAVWASGSLRLRAQVSALRRTAPERRFRIELAAGEVLAADAVILACAAPHAALALETCDPALAEALRGFGTTACATVSLVYERARLGRPLRSFGCFVPRGEPLPIVAVSFASEKFAGRARADQLLVRAFLGGARRPDLLEQGDAELVADAHDSVAGLLGLASPPLHSRVFRHPAAMPRFAVGHGERVASLRALLERQPGLFLAGSSAGAYGIPDCIASARDAAEGVLTLCPALRACTSRRPAPAGATMAPS